MDYPFAVQGKIRTAFVPMLIQHWCAENCQHPYELEHCSDSTLIAKFESQSDLTKFSLSRQYGFIEDHATVDKIEFYNKLIK